MENNIRFQLFLTIVILSVLPLSATYLFLDDIINKTLDLSSNVEITETINDCQNNLKKLKYFDKKNEYQYKRQFLKAQKLKTIYDEYPQIRENLVKSLITYWAIGFAFALLVALAVAYLLSQNITKKFNNTLKELIKSKERINYIKDISVWQDIARKLAHEIKNPLTPIEMLITGLKKISKNKTAQEFERHLDETTRIVAEEIGNIKNMLSRFSAFGKLPEVQLKKEILYNALSEYCSKRHGFWADVSITFSSQIDNNSSCVYLDTVLFAQVLDNLIQNAIEANVGDNVVVKINVSQNHGRYKIEISNTGRVIDDKIRDKIFDLYFSTKKKGDNIGIGLAVAKKTILEHHGDIECARVASGASFIINLPKEEVFNAKPEDFSS